jgi:antitoxin component YwqK of YwqJK toxin-antitoxin module
MNLIFTFNDIGEILDIEIYDVNEGVFTYYLVEKRHRLFAEEMIKILLKKGNPAEVYSSYKVTVVDIEVRKTVIDGTIISVVFFKNFKLEGVFDEFKN